MEQNREKKIRNFTLTRNNKEKWARLRPESYNLFPRASTINKIIQQYHFFVSWKPTGRHNPWALLESKLLVIPIYRLHQVMKRYIKK